MKKTLRGICKKMLAMVAVLTFVFTSTTVAFASSETWNGGQKVNYVPYYGESSYRASDWTNSLVNLYQLKWYENPTRQVLKGEFMLVELRTIQASLERQGYTKLSANGEVLNFVDKNTLVPSAREEVKILKSLGMLSGTPDGYMKMENPIKRSEASKVITYANDRILKIPAIRNAKVFNDTVDHWAESSISYAYQIGLLNGISDTNFDPDGPLTLEQTLQILENEVGYYGITREDVSKAMNQTFKVTLSPSLSVGSIPAESITLNKNIVNLTVENSEIVYATIKPNNTSNQNVIWTSFDSKIATVNSNGLIKAVAAGTTVIVSKTINGLEAYTTVVVSSPSINDPSLKSTINVDGYESSEYYNAFSNEEITFVVKTNQLISGISFSNNDTKLTQNVSSNYNGYTFKVKTDNLTKYGETLMTVTLNNNETLNVRICIFQK
ncbi:MAG: Ig-like surface protein [Clostridia bacterium]|jgi:hypothetical protein|nr:Ig-like surface protein [Clostridia bacterium]